jgi:hypothetical protein
VLDFLFDFLQIDPNHQGRKILGAQNGAGETDGVPPMLDI